MDLRGYIKTSVRKYLNESVTDLVKVEIQNASTIFNNKIEGGFLTKKQSEDLKSEIESHYNDELFSTSNNDIRQKVFNYDTPLVEKDLFGVNFRVAEGLIELDPNSNKNRKTYLLYANGIIVGKFYSVNDIKTTINYIEDNIVKRIQSNS